MVVGTAEVPGNPLRGADESCTVNVSAEVVRGNVKTVRAAPGAVGQSAAPEGVVTLW